MADFGDTNKALAGFAQKLQEKAGIAPTGEPVSTNIQAAPAAPETAPVVTPAPVQQTPVTPTEQVPPVADPKAVSTDPAPPADENADAWDKDLTTAPPVTGPISLEEISSALKIENVKSKDDLVAQFTQREARIKELETAQQNQFQDIPEELRDVLEVTRKGGDWKAYLGARVIDYSKADPIKLFEQAVDNSPRFRKADGSFDQAAADLELSQIPDSIKETQGNLIKQNLMAEQAQRRNAIVTAAEQKRTEFNRGLSEAARNIGTTLSKEKIGVTLEPKHSDILYAGIRDGSLIKKHLGNTDVSGVDPNKLARTIAMAEWGERFAEHQHKQGIVAGKKAMLSDKQNVQLNTPQIPVNPSQGDRPKTAAEKLKGMYAPPADGQRHL